MPLLLKDGHTISFIMTCKASPEYTKTEDDFKDFAFGKRIPFLITEKINSPETIEFVRKNKADIAISANWKTLIKKEFISEFKLGIINAHPGDLPKFRGNACSNWAIITGEKKLVATLHFMDEGLDEGDILLKKSIRITEETTIGDTTEKLIEIYPKMFAEVINRLEKKTIRPMKQAKKGASRGYSRTPEDSEINWNSKASEIDRLVRGSSKPFSGAYTYLDGKKLIVWKAHPVKSKIKNLGTPGQVAERRKGFISILTKEGFLVLDEIEYEGKKAEASEIIKSGRERLGMNYSKEIEKLFHS